MSLNTAARVDIERHHQTPQRLFTQRCRKYPLPNILFPNHLLKSPAESLLRQDFPQKCDPPIDSQLPPRESCTVAACPNLVEITHTQTSTVDVHYQNKPYWQPRPESKPLFRKHLKFFTGWRLHTPPVCSTRTPREWGSFPRPDTGVARPRMVGMLVKGEEQAGATSTNPADAMEPIAAADPGKPRGVGLRR